MSKREDDGIETLIAAMRFKLVVNSHKGDIGDVEPERLIQFLRSEVDELEYALKRGNKIEIMLEAADVANFALAAAMNAVERHRNRKNSDALEGSIAGHQYEMQDGVLTTYWKLSRNGQYTRCNKDGSI